jgi:hypothetical protein
MRIARASLPVAENDQSLRRGRVIILGTMKYVRTHVRQPLQMAKLLLFLSQRLMNCAVLVPALLSYNDDLEWRILMQEKWSASTMTCRILWWKEDDVPGLRRSLFLVNVTIESNKVDA